MRDVVLYTLLSLDGVAEEPGNWMFEGDDEGIANLASVIATQDDVLLGRRTYDDWADYWPSSDVQPFADFINGTTKHVFTSDPAPLPGSWAHTVSADDSLLPYVDRLRAGPGADIGVHGSIGLARDLLAADLVDRLELALVPTLAGTGRRLLTEAASVRRLTLTKATRSRTGSVFLAYQRH